MFPTIYTMVIVFMTIMGERGYNCDTVEIMEKTAIVECYTKHNFVVEQLDIRKNKNVLVSYGRIL